MRLKYVSVQYDIYVLQSSFFKCIKFYNFFKEMLKIELKYQIFGMFTTLSIIYVHYTRMKEVNISVSFIY